jgi:putative resolvase
MQARTPTEVNVAVGVGNCWRRADLDRQVARLSEWTAQSESAVVRVEAEVGSGFTGRGARCSDCWLIRGWPRWWWSVGIGWGRVNTELVAAALSAHWRRLVVLDCGEVTEDLMRDMVVVLFTSFCARLYGRWSARNRATTAVGSAQTQYRAETCRCRG